jgi:cytochrome c5
MSHKRWQPRMLKLLVTLSLLPAGIWISNSESAYAQQDLPDGKGVEIAREKCLLCHEADLIVSQRLSRAGWVREVDKMIRWGAVVSDADKEPLVDYFAARFGPGAAASKAPTADDSRGKEILENSCLLCHEIDLVQQQRLTQPGWSREVDKMVRWGAVVADKDKEPLVAYLFKNYGPRVK